MSDIWAQTWLVVVLGIVCVFLFLAFLSWGLKMMSAYVAKHPGKDEKAGAK